MSTRPSECGYCGLDHPSSRPCREAAREYTEHEQVMLRALMVVELTPHVRAYLEQHDPKLLAQVRAAIAWVRS